MNKEEDILYTALENLYKNTGIKAIEIEQLGFNNRFDATAELIINNKPVKVFFEIKNHLRQYNILPLLERKKELTEKKAQFVFLTEHLFPKVKEELRQNNIAYLEANGNIFMNNKNIMLFIDGNKPVKIGYETESRAFTKTGIRVVFQFLLNDQWVNLPYRDIANKLDIALGNIYYVVNGLKELGFLIKQDKYNYKLINKKELLNKWMTAYNERLKPALLMGTFRFFNDTDRYNWKTLLFDQLKTHWGGEPGGDLFTNRLRPEIFTIYTAETRNDIIKNYRLVPDDKGEILIYKKFWYYTETTYNVVPPLLVYTDLINTNDKRCAETAQIIYDQQIASNF